MNHRIAVNKFLHRTCLALKHNAELHTNATPMAWRCYYKQQDSPCNSNAMTTLMTSKAIRFYSKFTSQQHPTAGTPLCNEKAYELVMALKDAERSALKTALDKYEAVKLKEGFEEANAAPPTSSDLSKIFFVNAVPFVVFGFLDNFCMIMAGDYIEQIFGTFMCISTMAAAGLGNTISDVLGIGTAFYVERFCTFLGLKPPDLVPIQMEMKECRRATNWGRIIGITIGCLLGMFPLLFMNNTTDDTKAPSSTTKKQEVQPLDATEKKP